MRSGCPAPCLQQGTALEPQHMLRNSGGRCCQRSVDSIHEGDSDSACAHTYTHACVYVTYTRNAAHDRPDSIRQQRSWKSAKPIPETADMKQGLVWECWECASSGSLQLHCSISTSLSLQLLKIRCIVADKGALLPSRVKQHCASAV